MNASFSWSYLLRTLALGLLVVGILARPVLAIACEIHDVQKATTSAGQAAAADETGSDESCCSLPDCNDCCAHTTAVIPELLVAPTVSMRASPLPSLSMKFEPAAVPVAFRPPIRT